MTIKSLLHWGGFGGETESSHVPIERWHSSWDHKSHGHGHSHHKGGGKGGGNSAVLSALALLAFLFLINVMQQSLQENNATMPAGTTTALLVREDVNPVLLIDRQGEMIPNSREMESFVSDDAKNKQNVP